jgi:hypothetical protein
MALVRRVIHLREHNVASTTPITTYKPNEITLVLHNAVCLMWSEVGLVEADISVRSLRAGGAMALLCAQVDGNVIRLLGRWQYNAIIRYLHVQAGPVMPNFASQMLQHDVTSSKMYNNKTPKTFNPTLVPFPPFFQLGLQHQLCYWEMVAARAHSTPLVTT